jgi:hypothetical protein
MRNVALFALAVGCLSPSSAFAQDDADTEEPAPKKKKSPNVTVTPNDQVDNEKAPPPAQEWTPPTDRKGRPLKTLPYEDYETAPPGYRLGGKSRKALWIPGVTLLASGYFLSAASSLGGLFVEGVFCLGGGGSTIGCYDGRVWGWGFLPLVGPFVITADDDFNAGWRITYGIFGVLQNAGLALTIAGFTAKEPVWERKAYGSPLYEPEVVVGPGYAGLKLSFD